METQLPRQLRLHREPRPELPRTKTPATEIPPAHFRVESRSSPLAAVVSPSLPAPVYESAPAPQLLPLTLSKTAANFSQRFRTTLPLFLMDGIGFFLSLLVSQFCASLFLTGLVAIPPVSSQLLLQAAAFVLVYGLLGLYPGIGLNPIVELKSLILGNLSAGALLAILTFAQGSGNVTQAISITALTISAACVAPLMRIIARECCCKCSWWGQPALIIGSHESARTLMNSLSRKTKSGLRPIGIIDDGLCMTPPDAGAHEFIGTLSDVAELADRHHIFWAFIAPGHLPRENAAIMARYCQSIPNIVIIPEFPELPSLWNHAGDVGGMLGIHYRERLLNPWASLFKRFFDVMGVVLGTLILSPLLVPLLLVTWASMKIYSPGPVFYGQDRVGKNGRPFRAWKFRTMIVDADAALTRYLQNHPEMKLEWDANQKLRKDPRIIPGIGNFLRMTSLDELPQLWNVLIGEMSLVGPRPFMIDQLDLYGETFSLYQKVRPGMSGLWQISGRNHMTFQQRAQLDAYYVRNWSWWLDLFILGRTIKTVLLREGAF